MATFSRKLLKKNLLFNSVLGSFFGLSSRRNFGNYTLNQFLEIREDFFVMLPVTNALAITLKLEGGMN